MLAPLRAPLALGAAVGARAHLRARSRAHCEERASAGAPSDHTGAPFHAALHNGALYLMVHHLMVR